MDSNEFMWIHIGCYGFLMIIAYYYAPLLILKDRKPLLWIPMQSNELLRMIMDSYGILWITMDSYEFLRIPMDYYGLQWITMDSYIIPWIPMEC